MSPSTLNAAVLKTLADHDQLVTDHYVVLALAVDYGLKVHYTEVRDALSKLEEKRHVVSVRRNDEIVVWSATGLGKSILSELR